MRTVILLKKLALIIPLIPIVYLTLRLRQSLVLGRKMRRDGFETSITQISSRRSLISKAALLAILLSLVFLSAVSVSIPVQPVWNAIGHWQRLYWIAAVGDRIFVAVTIFAFCWLDDVYRDQIRHITANVPEPKKRKRAKGTKRKSILPASKARNASEKIRRARSRRNLVG